VTRRYREGRERRPCCGLLFEGVILPSSVALFSAQRVGLKVLPVKVPALRYSVGIITVKNRTPSPLAKLFIDLARAVAQSISAPATKRKPTVGEGV